MVDTTVGGDDCSFGVDTIGLCTVSIGDFTIAEEITTLSEYNAYLADIETATVGVRVGVCVCAVGGTRTRGRFRQQRRQRR